MTERTRNQMRDELQGLLDELIEAYRKREDNLKAVREFEERNVQPTAPESFDSVEDLAEYNNLQRRYDEGLALLKGHVERASQQYSRLSNTVRQVLPQGTSVIHTTYYTHQGKYRIHHSSSGEVEVLQ